MYVFFMILVCLVFYIFVNLLDLFLRTIFCKRNNHDCKKCKNWFCLDKELEDD